MPPKLKDKKKKDPNLILDGVNITKMSEEELIRHIIKEVQTLYQTKKKRSFGEQERDIIYRQLELAREELANCQDDVIMQANQMEEKRVNQHAELKVHRQRANYLKYELERDLQKAMGEQETFLAENSKLHVNYMTEIAMQQTDLKVKIIDERKTYEQKIKETMALAERHYTEARQNYLNALCDRSEDLEAEKDDIDEISQLDIRNCKNLLDQQRLEHISNLKKNFERNYEEIKHYFQELTCHNLTMIDDLTRQSEAIKGHYNELHKRYRDIQRDTEMNREPLRLQTAKLVELKKQVETHKKEKYSLARLQHNVDNLERERCQLQTDIATYEQDYKRVQLEYKELRSSFAPAIMEAKQIIGSEAMLVRQKACAMQARVELLKTTLRERVAANQDTTAENQLRQLELFERRYYDNVATKRDLQDTYHKMVKLYNDSLFTIRYILEKYDITTQDKIDLQPLLLGTMALKPAEIGRVGSNRDFDTRMISR